MERLKLFKDGESVEVMKDLGTLTGVEISPYATEVETREELYTSLNTLTFRYAEGLPYLVGLKRNNYVRAYTNGFYNLYVINEVVYDTVDSTLEVHCVHYTTLYAGEAIPDMTLFSKTLTLQDVVNKLNNSPYKSPEYNIRIDSRINTTEVVDLTGHSFGNNTVGTLWTGSDSFLRTYFGVLIVRDLQGITLIKPEQHTLQRLPLTLGVNIKGLEYKLEEPERYTTAMVNLATIPTIEVQGTGLEDTKYVYNGVANTNLSTFNEMSEGDEIQVFYKGLLIRIFKTGGSLYTMPYSEPKLLHTIESIGIQPLFHQNVATPFNGTRFKIVQGDKGNEVTILDEEIDTDYLVGYRAYVDYKNIWADPQGQVGTKKYFGFTPEPSNGVGDDLLDIIFSRINKELYKVPVTNPYYEGRGNNVYLVDYPEPKADLVRTKDNPRGFTEAYHFYRWFFQGYRGFWDSKEAKKLNQPKFKATIEVDTLTSIFGVEYFNNTQYMLGDKYRVIAQNQGLEFESEVTTITYSVTDEELISVEFGNYQDFEIEKVKNTTQNTEQARRIYQSQSKTTGGTTTKTRTNTKPTIELKETTINYKGPESSAVFRDNLISAYDKEDGDITHKVVIEQTETDATYSVTDSDGNTTTKKASIKYGESSSGEFDEDELGEWIEDVMNGDDIRDEKDLFDGDLPYIKRTDDTGIPRMEWDPPYVTISPDGNESTQSKLLCYNGAEAVIDEVRFKGEYGSVGLDIFGSFRIGYRNFLPDNEGWEIVPHPNPDEGGSVNWAPVFDVRNYEGFNKDTEHGTFPFDSRRNSTPEDLEILREELGYRYHYAVNATTKGTIKFETKRVMNQRYLREVSKDLRGSIPTEGFQSEQQIKDIDEFKKYALDLAIGKTVRQTGYNNNYPPEDQSLIYYTMQVENGEQPYIKTIYRQFLRGIADKVTRVRESPAVIKDGVITIHFEVLDETTWVKRVTGVDIDEQALEQVSLRHGLFIKEEPGWQRLIFTQPTTKVNDQTVRVNQLLITNGGTSAQNALISKESVDELWKLLTPEERKEFEDIYGKEWLFNLRNTPDQYDSDDVLFGAFYRVKNKIKPPGAIDPFGLNARLVRQDEERAKRISERYQQKYNYLVNKGYTVTPSHSGQVAYDRVEKYYLEQAPIES